MNDLVHRLLQDHGRLHTPLETVSPSANLYDAGLTPFAAIRIMLALEEELDIEFPVSMLRRQSFASIDAIVACLRELRSHEKSIKREAA